MEKEEGCSMVIQSFDSLWFFTNLFSSKNHRETGFGVDPGVHIITGEESKTESMIPVLDDNPVSEIPRSPVTCPKCGDFDSRLVREITEGSPLHESREEMKKEDFDMEMGKRNKKKGGRSKRRMKMKMKMEMEMNKDVEEGSGFYSEENYGSEWFLFGLQENEKENEMKIGYQKFTAGKYDYNNNHQSYHQMKLPPLSDGSAMKEHIKSWAYAVACTVR